MSKRHGVRAIFLVSVIYFSVIEAFVMKLQGQCDKSKVYECTSKIYCSGELLKTIELARIYNDSKTFVDLPQLNNPNVTLKNFETLMVSTNRKPTRKQLEKFLSENFEENATELDDWLPSDWTNNPKLIKRVKDPKYKDWIKNLCNIWKILAKKISPKVAQNPDKHSLIYAPNGFIIPGGRFKEFYYWDSYWIIKGLLLTDMSITAKGMIENFLSLVKTYGFIPNGGRVYYLMRSQPPLLIPMVHDYLKYTHDYEFLKKNIAVLDEEFQFWLCERSVKVKKGMKTYSMFRYISKSDEPRPESFREDFELAENFPSGKRRPLYEDLKAAAESGWDFSARWFITNPNVSCDSPPDALGCRFIGDVSTRYIIPVDLNSFLERNARYLSTFHKSLGQLSKSKYYRTVADALRESIEDVLWNEKDGTWYDYDILNKQPRKTFYPSNLTPLCTMSYNADKARTYGARAVKYLNEQNITQYSGGTPSSLYRSGQQWDFPNAWPPLQSIIAFGLLQTNYPPAMNTGSELASTWLRANYYGFVKYKQMFEKYDALNPGQFGGGGEYQVQAGFGWTNGVVFEFLDLLPNVTNSS